MSSRYEDLRGTWFFVNAQRDVVLPGTTDWMEYGPHDVAQPWHPDVKELPEEGRILNRLTRKHAFSGKAVFERDVCFPAGGRVFAFFERSRMLTLEVNGQDVPPLEDGTLAGPFRFEVTSVLTGHDRFRLSCDNTYAGLPRKSIYTSSGATDETQTNWNGVLGEMCLKREQDCFLRDLRVLCGGDGIRVRAILDAARPYAGVIRAGSGAFGEVQLNVDVEKGCHELEFPAVFPSEACVKWDVYEGNLQTVRVWGDGLEEIRTEFGVRVFGSENGMFSLNGRPVFLRGETCCAEFPETGYEPTDRSTWLTVMRRYRDYGVNLVRFHSHIPPEAALQAADETGMLVQLELNCWNPVDAMEDDTEYRYYRKELETVLRVSASHPSFVMMTMGNELHAGEKGLKRLEEMVRTARQQDSTRLYAIASNPFYGRFGVDGESGFYTSQNSGEHQMRLTSAGMKGPLNEARLNTCLDFSDTIRAIRGTSTVPVCSFEIGQYEVLPELEQADRENAVMIPDNFRWMREQVEKTPMARDWDQRIQASGELSLSCYRWETEAALRTPGLGGMCLLGLQDFPGQGTALVGMMDSWMQPKKGFGAPERTAAFFRDVSPLALLPEMNWHRGDTFEAGLMAVNFGRTVLEDRIVWELRGSQTSGGETDVIRTEPGDRKTAGKIRIRLPEGKGHERMTLHLSYAGAETDYPICVFGSVEKGEAAVHAARELNAEALNVLRAGGRVLLQCEGSVQSQYSTNFWSVGTFPFQSGCMGYYLNPQHPLFRTFPTGNRTDVQWQAMAAQKAMLCPDGYNPVLEIMTTPLRLRRLCQMLECRCEGGRLMITCLDLEKPGAPELDGFRESLYAYLSSDAFDPRQEMDAEQVKTWIHSC